jgi:hypothetical protein
MNPEMAGPMKMAVKSCVQAAPAEARIPSVEFLTAEEVSVRYRGAITLGTLRNWRAMRIGPPFIKIGKAVLYRISELDAWDKKNTVVCRTSRQFMTNDS